jgi:hypothetical protein
LHLFYKRHFELNSVLTSARIDWSHRIFREQRFMYEWLLLRLLLFGAMVGGGALLALAGYALDRWREGRSQMRSACDPDAAALPGLTLVAAPRSSAQRRVSQASA